MPAQSVYVTGRDSDGTGLYYYRARYYDPGRSRFVQQDSAGIAGLTNAYAYVRGNPLSFVDPLGLYTEVIQWGPIPDAPKSRWGHISGNINGENWSWGPGGWDRNPSAAAYARRQQHPTIDRGGRGVILDLSDAEELLLTQCLSSFATSEYGEVLNNCGNPWVKCLQKLGVVNADDQARVLPYDVYGIISSSPRAIGHSRYPGSNPPVGAR